jgi:hypothetical protein
MSNLASELDQELQNFIDNYCGALDMPPDDLPSRSHIQRNNDAGSKFDAGKLRYDLLPARALREVVQVITDGAAKYGDWNWLRGIRYSRHIAAAKRHIAEFEVGKIVNHEDFDCHHIAHAIVCLFFILEYEYRGMRSKLNDLQGQEVLS